MVPSQQLALLVRGQRGWWVNPPSKALGHTHTHTHAHALAY